MITRRSAFAVFAAAFVAPIAAYAQVGGSSATAPSNSEGTPSSGPALNTTQPERPATTRTTRRRRRTQRRHRTSTSGQ